MRGPLTYQSGPLVEGPASSAIIPVSDRQSEKIILGAGSARGVGVEIVPNLAIAAQGPPLSLATPRSSVHQRTIAPSGSPWALLAPQGCTTPPDPEWAWRSRSPELNHRLDWASPPHQRPRSVQIALKCRSVVLQAEGLPALLFRQEHQQQDEVLQPAGRGARLPKRLHESRRRDAQQEREDDHKLPRRRCQGDLQCIHASSESQSPTPGERGRPAMADRAKGPPGRRA